MKLAYLLTCYPMTSSTFIRREIQAIEALGQPVARFAVRHWDHPLVDPGDVAEQARTEYLLTGSKLALVRDVIATLIAHPVRLLKLLPLWWRVWRNAGGDFIKHCAYLIEAMAFVRRAGKLGIEHVHVHFSTNPATVAMFAHRLGGPKYSFTIHGPDELATGRPAALSLALKARDAAFVVAITRYCRGRILEEAPDAADKVHIVHCGIDLNDFPFDPVQPENGRVICIGRLCSNKGQIHIPPAVAAVIGEYPDLVVELIGGGEDEGALREAISRHGVEKNVVLSGWGTGEYVRTQLSASRAMMLPSYAEGLPIAIMEAFALGRPTLSTTVAGIPELLDDSCGWIFAPGDEEAIAQALRGLMRASAEERAALATEGRRRVVERHDIRKSAQALLAVFQETVDNRRR